VSKVNERVQTCHGKINLIRGSNKATTIFSTAKFPTSKQLMLRKPLFGINEQVRYSHWTLVTSCCHSSLPPTPTHPPTPPHPRFQILILKQKMMFIIFLLWSQLLSSQVRSSQWRSNRCNPNSTLMALRCSALSSSWRTKGSGRFLVVSKLLGRSCSSTPTPIHTRTTKPSTISSVVAGGLTLLFSLALALALSLSLSLSHRLCRVKEAQEDITKGLASAPTSLLSGEALPDIAALDLTYKPQMGVMTALALPSNLPLDFLADIHFDGAALPSIAPSSHRGAADYSLPQITDGTTVGSAFAASSQYAPGPSAKQPPPAPNSAPPPPPPSSAPPPPPPASAPPPPPPPSAVTAPPPPPVASAPPPPPPPTANIEDIDEDDSGASPPPKNSLMDAIKGMSVTKLRSKEEAQVLRISHLLLSPSLSLPLSLPLSLSVSLSLPLAPSLSLPLSLSWCS
jgi:hypothetical protein